MTPPITSPTLLYRNSSKYPDPKPFVSTEKMNFPNAHAAKEALLHTLKDCGILDPFGMYLGDFSYLPNPPPLDQESQEKLKKIDKAMIKVCTKSGELLLELNQGTYIKDFNNHLKKGLKDNNLTIDTYLRGGMSNYVTDVFSYIEFFIQHHFKSTNFTQPKKITDILEYLKNNGEEKKEPHDIDWLDIISGRNTPANLPLQIKDLYIDYIATQSSFSTENVKQNAFLQLMIPSKQLLYPEPGPYCSSTIGDTTHTFDRTSGVIDKAPCLFTSDPCFLPIVINGELIQDVIPQSPRSRFPVWPFFIDNYFKIIRFFPHHLEDFRSALVALHLLTEGAFLDERYTTLQEIFNHNLSLLIAHPELKIKIYHLILDRFNKHSENTLSYFINLFLYLQISSPPEIYSVISWLWVNLKKEVFKTTDTSLNSCPITRAILEALSNDAINFDTFCQSLFQLVLYLSSTDLDHEKSKVDFKCTVASLGTPFIIFEFSHSRITFPISFHQIKNPRFPFIFDHFTQKINPSNRLKNPSSSIFYNLLIDQINHLAAHTCFLSQSKIFVLFLIGTKKPLSQLPDQFKYYLMSFIVELVNQNDHFPIRETLAQLSPGLFNEILSKLPPEMKERIENFYEMKRGPRLQKNEQRPLQTTAESLSEDETHLKAKNFVSFSEGIPSGLELEKYKVEYSLLKHGVGSDFKAQLFTLILNGYIAQTNISAHLMTQPLIIEIIEIIFKDGFYQNVAILSSWKRCLFKLSINLEFLHDCLVNHYSEILSCNDACQTIFIDLFLLCKKKLQNKDLQNLFLSHMTKLFNSEDIPEFESKTGQFVEGCSLDLYTFNLSFFDLCLFLLKSKHLKKPTILLKIFTDLLKKSKEEFIERYLVSCLGGSIDDPERFKTSLRTIQKQGLLSQALLNALFETHDLYSWDEQNLEYGIHVLKTKSEFSSHVQKILKVLLIKKTTTQTSFESLEELSSLDASCIDEWLTHSLNHAEDYARCFKHLLTNSFFDSRNEITLSIWGKLLAKLEFTNEVFDGLAQHFSKLQALLKSTHLKNSLPHLFEQCVGFMDQSPSISFENCAFCIFLRSQIGEHSDQWNLLDILNRDDTKTNEIFSLIDLFEESSENISKAKPFLKKALQIAFQKKTFSSIKAEIKEKILRIWPNCIEIEFINQSKKPEELLNVLLASESSESRQKARKCLFTLNILPKQFNSLALLALQKELENFISIDQVVEIIERLNGNLSEKIQSLLLQYQKKILVKMNENSIALENVKLIFSLLNRFKIPSSEELEPLFLNLLEKGSGSDQTENATFWISLCTESACFSRFPQNATYLNVLLTLFSHAKKHELKIDLSRLRKHLAPLFLQSEKKERELQLESFLINLEYAPNELVSSFLWTLSITPGSEAHLVDFFIREYENHLEGFTCECLTKIYTPLFEWLGLEKTQPVLALIAKKVENSQAATSVISLFLDPASINLTLLYQIIPKIKNSSTLLRVFDVLMTLPYRQGFDDELDECIIIVLKNLYLMTNEPQVALKLIAHLNLLELIPERERDFFLLYKGAKKLFKTLKDDDLPLIQILMRARSDQYKLKNQEMLAIDFEWLKLLKPSQNTLSQEIFLAHFCFTIDPIDETEPLFKSIFPLLGASIYKIKFSVRATSILSSLVFHIYENYQAPETPEKLFESLIKNCENEALFIVAAVLQLIQQAKQCPRVDLLNLFLKKIIDANQQALYSYVDHHFIQPHELSTGWTFEPNLRLSFCAAYFKNLALQASKEKIVENCFGILDTFQADFLKHAPNLWPLIIENLVAAFVSTPLLSTDDIKQAELSFKKYFSLLLAHSIDMKLNPTDSGISEAIFKHRETLREKELMKSDQNALKFTSDLITAFYSRKDITLAHFRMFFFILRDYLSDCVDGGVDFQANFTLLKKVMYAHLTMATSLDDPCLEEMRSFLIRFFKISKAIESIFILEAQLIFSDIEIEPNLLALTTADYINYRATKTKISLALDVIQQLSLCGSSVSLLYMINILHHPRNFLEFHTNDWQRIYTKIFESFRFIDPIHPLFNLCVIGLYKNFFSKDIPTYAGDNFKDSTLIHKELFIKISDFTKTYFNRDDQRRARGIFLIINLLETALTETKLLTHAEYLNRFKELFDWSLIIITEKPEFIREAFHLQLVKKPPVSDSIVQSQILHDWIIKLFDSPGAGHEVALFYFLKDSTSKALSQRHKQSISTRLKEAQ